MKNDMAGSEDPLFTTQTVKQCASCSKGIVNMSGYRADRITWDAFPLKDPASRMLKSGMGFRNLFDKSQQDTTGLFDNIQDVGARSQKLLNNPHSSKASIGGVNTVRQIGYGGGDTSTNISSHINLGGK